MPRMYANVKCTHLIKRAAHLVKCAISQMRRTMSHQPVTRNTATSTTAAMAKLSNPCRYPNMCTNLGPSRKVVLFTVHMHGEW